MAPPVLVAVPCEPSGAACAECELRAGEETPMIDTAEVVDDREEE